MTKTVLPNIKFIRQPNGYTCGTTSLYNLATSMGMKAPELLDLADAMGTNPRTGTTDVEMKNGLKILGLPVKRYAERKDGTLLMADNEQGPNDALNALKDGIDRGEAYLLRTLMGMYHWVLVYGYTGDQINYMCSCSGPGLFSAHELYRVWGARDFDGFRVKTGL